MKVQSQMKTFVSAQHVASVENAAMVKAALEQQVQAAESLRGQMAEWSQSPLAVWIAFDLFEVYPVS